MERMTNPWNYVSYLQNYITAKRKIGGNFAVSKVADISNLKNMKFNNKK
jgi:hypothetical protein